MTSAIIASFDGASRSYDGAADIQSIVAEHMLADVAQFAPRSILDIGCGTGLLTALAHQRWPEAAITAVDASPAMLDMARAKVPSARFVRADAAKLDLGERFDLVFSSMVLPAVCGAFRTVRCLMHPVLRGSTPSFMLPRENFCTA